MMREEGIAIYSTFLNVESRQVSRKKVLGARKNPRALWIDKRIKYSGGSSGGNWYVPSISNPFHGETQYNRCLLYLANETEICPLFLLENMSLVAFLSFRHRILFLYLRLQTYELTLLRESFLLKSLELPASQRL